MLISLSKNGYTKSLVTAKIQKAKAEKRGLKNVRIEEEREDVGGCLDSLRTVYFLRCD